ncbi:type VI secretion system membrane subunit TssM [Billgrantia montanilacus]|uniref:Type VI secretion system membrane subunit TssM n=1 Tax=Billgrantia montanilacus TaxID=2282305 RepID=A0A368TXB9_9GAMM|nr:type VI secretion system membrane subunit TssM [Halomonas montanilacus]RCV88877.1 type VI secretion system membrane subunit TssM [Halomonas montanilacus]
MWKGLKSGLSRWVPGASRAQSNLNRAKGHGNKAQGIGKKASKLTAVLWCLVLAALVAAIWWLGPMWEVRGSYPLGPWLNRLLATLALATLVALVWGIRLARRLRDMDEERRHAERLQFDPAQMQVEQQEENLNATLNELIDNLGSGPGARYKLPWYLVMGVENAGKTSLINRSGQNFALTHVMKASGQGKKGQFGFDWWIGDKAVLIDPDGELLTQGAMEGGEPQELESRLWDHFTGWLERNRSQRPLDGVVLVLDLARLSDAKVAVRKAYASLLRARLRELMERHGARLPVYVTFSKMDLLHGFDDFFRHYSRAARRAPLGFTFSADSLERPGQWEAEFATAYDEMLERLNRSLPSLLAECRDREERESVFRFVRQLAGLRDVLLGFLCEALSSDRFSTAAMVRGTYFTSVYQQGVPEDPFVDAAARRYGMAESIQPAHRAARSALYFTEELFDKVIYPEAGLAGDNARAARRRRRVRRTSVVACLLGAAVLLGGWSHFYQKNSTALAAVEEKAQDFLASKPDELQGDDPTGYAFLDPLDRLRGATLAFGDYRDQLPWLADMGLYQGQPVGREVESAYLAMLSYHFLPSLMVGIMDDMNRAEEGSNEKLALLRVLRMMSDASGRQPERVHDFMARRWQREFAQRGSVQERLLDHLDYAMTHTDLEGSVAAGDRNAELAMTPLRGSLQAAQEELSRQPMDERVYATLKAGSDRRSGAVLDLRQGVGPAFSAVFMARDDEDERLRLPTLVTRDGFEGYFLKEVEQATELALIDLWVLGRRDDITFSEADQRQLRDALHERYVSDYHVTWRQVLDDVFLVPIPDIDQAVVVADTLLGASRPLDRLLGEVANHTRLYPELPVDDEAARQALERSPRYRLAGDIERNFTELNGLLDARGNNPSDIAEIKTAIAELRDYLRHVQGASDPGRAAFVSARDRLALRGGDPIHNLKRIAENTPAPVDRMLESLADQSWQLLMASAIRHLEHQWLDDVVTPYKNRLAGRYPLVAGASRDVALTDFEAFFGPGGTLDSFYQDNLRPFIEEAPEQLLDADGNSLLRGSVFTAFQRAEQIREAYFGRDGVLDVEFSLEPVSLSPDKRRGVISVDGQLIEYAHSASHRVSMIWPNTLRGGTESRVTLVPSQVNRSPRSMSRDGAWAWFRLLDEAEITSAGERDLELRFSVDGGTIRYRLSANGSRNPFTRPLAAGFQLPTALYAEGGLNADDV